MVVKGLLVFSSSLPGCLQISFVVVVQDVGKGIAAVCLGLRRRFRGPEGGSTGDFYPSVMLLTAIRSALI